MRIFSPDGENIVLEADDLQDAIELQSLSTFSFADKIGIRAETNRNQYFRAIIPARPSKPPGYADFDHWWNVQTVTQKDQETKRLCTIAWRAAIAYAYAPDAPPEGEARDTGIRKVL